MHEVEITEMPMPRFPQKVMAVPNLESVTTFVRNAIRDACGDDLNRLYVEKQAINSAFELRCTGNTNLVLILNAGVDEEGVANGFAKGKTRVSVPLEVNVGKEFMSEVFKNINSNKAKKPKTSKKQQENENE
jgi:hypothetical protein